MRPVQALETSLQLTVNGRSHTFSVSRATTLLHVLRNDLALNGPKLGCGLGQCGACTVWVDGEAARACVMPAQELSGRSVTTLEGLGTLDKPHLVQQAFIDAQAAQCGYCMNGMIMMAAILLRDNEDPSDYDIRRALSANLCRCGTHIEIMQAVRLAAQRLRAQKKATP
jgi:nicotinate dehydrogenase subunit A